MKTRILAKAPGARCRQGGSAAIELAFLLPILLIFMSLPIFYARCLWHYTAAQKAAQDAARYLASVPRSEMLSSTSATAAANRAVQIATREIAELAPGGQMVGPLAYCNGAMCGNLIPIGSLPQRVTVELGFIMTDPWFGVETWGGIPVNASVTLNYVGN
jgi:Flp pilus assembly protein TadG